jgi:hypothetical protein
MLRALRGLVRDGALVRLGYGVYGRAETSQLSGRPMLARLSQLDLVLGNSAIAGCRLSQE